VEARAKEKKLQNETADFNKRIRIFWWRVLAWSLWGMMLGGSFVAVWFVVQSTTQEPGTFLANYGSILIFSFINGAFPLAIKRLPNMESYQHPKTILMMNIIRTFLLRMLILYALLYGYFNQTKLNQVQLPTYSAISITPENNCAGTVMGQLIYRLVWVDMVASHAQRLGLTIFFYLRWVGRVEEHS